jgi:hypothetical protein
MRAKNTQANDTKNWGLGIMKRTTGPAKPGIQKTVPASDPISVLSRIKLAFLDEYTCEKRGYDPYDTSKGRAPDIWTSKPKRA